jgi:aspartyl protease family protein
MRLAEPEGPWSAPKTSPPPRPRIRPGFWLWLALIAAGVGFFVLLSLAFPTQLTAMDDAEALRLIGLLALVSSSLVFARRLHVRTAIRNAAAWVGICAAIALGYSFRGEIESAFDRVRGELIPAYAVPRGDHALTLTASDDGAFNAMGSVDGTPVRFTIDTGASGVVLSPAVARRIGLDPETLTYSGHGETANGIGDWAPYTAASLTLGPIRLSNMPVAINRAPMSTSLLGMSFLRRLDGFEVRGDRITLTWRGS